MGRIRLISQASLAFGFILSTSGAGTASEAKSFQDWSVTCHDDMCIASQTNFGPKETWLATVRLRQQDDGSAAVQVFVPAGVHLGSGLFVQLKSGKPIQVPYVTCSAETCEAVAELSANTIASWKQARAVSVRYRPALTSPPIAFDISMMGVTAALQETGGQG
ncbi:MAG: invasion associated locus B family protein [Pseudomonadota bacterium]